MYAHMNANICMHTDIHGQLDTYFAKDTVMLNQLNSNPYTIQYVLNTYSAQVAWEI